MIRKFFYPILTLIILSSFTIFAQNNLKVIRYQRANDGYLVIEYFEGKIKKQVKKNQVVVYDLPFNAKNELDNEIKKLNVQAIINEVDTIKASNQASSNMYLFIDGKDTFRTKFFPRERTPENLKKIDFLLYKKRN